MSDWAVFECLLESTSQNAALENHQIWSELALCFMFRWEQEEKKKVTYQQRGLDTRGGKKAPHTVEYRDGSLIFVAIGFISPLLTTKSLSLKPETDTYRCPSLAFDTTTNMTMKYPYCYGMWKALTGRRFYINRYIVEWRMSEKCRRQTF